VDAERSALVRELLAEMERRLRDGEPINGFGRRGDHVLVAMRADAETLAAELRQRYGDAVILSVGNFPYPFPHLSSSPRPRAPVATVAIEGLALRTTLDDAVVPSGRTVRGSVQFENHRSDRITLGTDDPLGGYVVTRGTLEIVGGSGRAARGVAQAISLEHGQTYTLGLITSTASTDATLGYLLPPGDYDVVVPIPLYRSLPEPGDDDRLLTPPVPLRLT
jgi:hypothetical protein